jgi:hypothetical protein
MSTEPILDVGNGLVSASLAGAGAWLSLGAPHSRHGFVELTALPLFEPAWRGDPAAVRRYRGYMTADRFRFLGLDVRAARHEVTTAARAGEPWIEQRHRLVPVEPHGHAVVRFHGRLDAHPLPEITDIDPPAATGARTRLTAVGDRLVIDAPALPARAEIRVTLEGGTSLGWVVAGHVAQLVVTWARATPPTLALRLDCSLVERADRPARLERAPARPRTASPAGALLPGAPPLHLTAALRPGVLRLVERTRRYVIECTAVRVGSDEVCLLTDHRILPLSWTRDAYWQAALLLAHDPDGSGAETVAAHLRWLWDRCERPERFWMRSHHSNGAVKDIAFQADQQLYPLLELADFRRVTGTLPAPPRGAASAREWWGAKVQELLDALPAGELGFLPSDENPADDAAELPFALSAQILYWLAETRLAELGLGNDHATAARELAAAIRRHFAVDGPLGRQWAYEIDGRGGHRLYHDANDLPTALAPLLGFCAADDPAWATTMRFAFGEHNPAFCPGPFGGLGSHHTPGTWTLGDVQQWVVASLLGEPQVAERAIDRMLAVAGPSGLLPEAYDPATGGSPIRHWFAWPGAALGALLPLAAAAGGDNAAG